MRIIFVGGGTLGSCGPLIAIAETLKKRDSHIDIVWIGTQNGPEKNIISSYGYQYRSIHAGKLRRYFSFKNFTDVVHSVLGFLQSLYVLATLKPSLIIGAGSFVQVPLIYARALAFRKTRLIIHQQDIKPGLANLLCAPHADRITVATKESFADFPQEKTLCIGNPIREEIRNGSIAKAYDIFHLDKEKPVVLILGGGTGAAALNALVIAALPYLLDVCQIIHVTGIGKERTDNNYPPTYHWYDLLTHSLAHAYAVADVCVTRAGFSTLTELAVLAKPILVIPMPNSHQEVNAAFFEKQHAAVVLKEKGLDPKNLAARITSLLHNQHERFQLSARIAQVMPSDATERLVNEIKRLADETIYKKKW